MLTRGRSTGFESGWLLRCRTRVSHRWTGCPFCPALNQLIALFSADALGRLRQRPDLRVVHCEVSLCGGCMQLPHNHSRSNVRGCRSSNRTTNAELEKLPFFNCCCENPSSPHAMSKGWHSPATAFTGTNLSRRDSSELRLSFRQLQALFQVAC